MQRPAFGAPRGRPRLSLCVATTLALACAGFDEVPSEDTTQAAGAPAAPPAQVPAPGAPAGEPSAAGEITPQLVALGDSIFHGQAAGGICFTCHGQGAKGSQIGPGLTDGQWLHGDGSQQMIINVITSGVATPKQYPGAMPPMGGAPLTPEQVRAVAAYVYSLSHPGA